MSVRPAARAYRFGSFVLDVAGYELRRNGRAVKVERRPMELLMLLVERRGELVTRGEIVDRLWGRDVFIDIDTSVNTVVRKIRRALRDSAGEPRFIRTVQGKGYRFIAAVEPAAGVVLALLPFENLTGAADRDYVADGLTEETIVALAQIDPGRVSVIGRTTSMAFRQTTRRLSDIGRELGADYLVEGSLRGGAGRIRVTATLVRARDEVQVWTETFARAEHDLLGLQAEIGGAIAQQVERRLTPQRVVAAPRRQTRDAEAYDLYLRGRHYYNQMTPATGARALECFQRATSLDPTYALAWAGIADTYSGRVFNSDARPAEVAPLARAAAARAMAHGEGVAEAGAAVGRVRFLFDWDWRAAEAQLRRAIELDPSSSQSHWMLGHALSQQGQHDRALAAAARARALDPLSALASSMSAQIAFSARDPEAAARLALDALHLEPDYWVAHWQLGQAYEQLGRIDDALAALAEASRLSGGNSKPASLSAYILASIGRIDDARAMLARLERRARDRYVPPYALALVHAGLRDDASMYACLDRAAIDRDVHLVYALVDPKWDAHRTVPRFAALLSNRQ
jgi:TolB-like protein/Flp pilus assembly protein TadD